jgi:adenosylcobinamide-phosphate synthase
VTARPGVAVAVPGAAVPRAAALPVALRSSAAAGVALLLDELLGEPPSRRHPVVLMGAYLGRAGCRVPAAPPGRAVVHGGLAWAAGAGGVALAGTVLARAGRRLPWPAQVVLHGVALWPLLSGRMLRREVAAVEDALARSLDDGRAQVARLVSRDTSALDAEGVRGAALGSLSENLCDSVVAPLIWHAVAGLPGAVLYRYVNTADAVWGYRSPRWQHAGRVAARADDLANLAPARLSALLLLAVARAGHLLPRLPAQARLTPSPNGGWPMGAMALVLDVRLVKAGVYALHPGGRQPATDDTRRALRLVAAATAAAWPLAAGMSLLREAVVHRAVVPHRVVAPRVGGRRDLVPAGTT